MKEKCLLQNTYPLYTKFKTFPFPIKSLALSAPVSPWTIHFRVLDKSPLPATDSLEKGMTPHSSILAWRNPWTEEPGRL